VAGALVSAAAQVMDGADGQLARLTDRVTAKGAFLDSVLDRVTDFAIVFGLIIYSMRSIAGTAIAGFEISGTWILAVGCGAAIGASQVSYATARAQALGLDYRRPEYAGKGTRTTAIVLAGLLSPLWLHAPLAALLYLAVHPNLAVARSVLASGDGRGA